MTVNELTKVNVGGTTHAPLSCNPRAARGRVVCPCQPRFFCFNFIFKLLILYCCGCGFGFSFLPDIRSAISNAGGMGTVLPRNNLHP